MLRAEILDLEDKYYLLKSKYDGVMSQIGEGQIVDESYYDGQVIGGDGNVYLGNENGASSDPSNFMDAPSNATTNPGERSIIQSPAESTEPRDLQVPQSQTELPPNSEPLPIPSSELDQSGLRLNPPRARETTDISVAFPRVVNSEAEIIEIVINQRTTRGRDVDGSSGDDGIDLMVEPTTADGQIQYQAGELTVSVIDPAESPDRQRVGLWKFLPTETELFFARDEQGSRGILLHLPWDQSTPVHESLELHVRFVTVDGRILKTSEKLRIHPPASDYSAESADVAAWVRQDSRWIPDFDHRPKTGVASASQKRAESTDNRHALSEQVRGTHPPAGRLIRAIPVKSQLQRPQWRPIR